MAAHLCSTPPAVTPALRRPLEFRTPASFQPSNFRQKTTSRRRICAMSNDFLGDFGGRDPFPGELESGFCEKPLGNANTEHRILIPSASVLSLAEMECVQISAFVQPMTREEAQKLLRKVVGWRLADDDNQLSLQCLWRLKDFASGVKLINRICKVLESTAHYPHLHLENSNEVRAELWTSYIGGLSMNDFIVAAKIDKIRTSDLVPRKRVWA